MPLWVHPEEAESSVEFLSKINDWSELEKIISRESGQDESQGFELLFYYGAMYGAVAMPQERKSKIPGTLVEKNGIDYCIHGLMHIKERVPYVQKNFRQIKEVVCETNLKKLFKLPNLIDQNRIDECKYLPVIDSLKAFGAVYGIIFYAWIMSRITGYEKEDEDYIMQLTAMEDERLIMVIGDKPVYVNEIRLPERLEHSYIQSSINNNYFNRFCTLRSLSHTDFIEKFAKSRGLKEAHGIYGLMHEPEIAYFLRYPQKAEEYKDRFKKCCFF